MSVPQDVVVSDETAARLDSITKYEGVDEDRQLLELAGFDAFSFRAFVSEIGKAEDPIAQRILEAEPVTQENQSSIQARQEHSA